MQQCERCSELLRQVAELQKRLRLSWDEVFWSKVERRGLEDCWPWRGAVNAGTGYGNYHVPNGIKVPELVSGPNVYAHRAAYYLSTGDALTTGDVIAHRCDNRVCCNPGHLFKTNHQGNVDDKVSKGRAWRKINAQTAELIMADHASGVSIPAIAKKYGLSRTYTWSFVNNKRVSRAKHVG